MLGSTDEVAVGSLCDACPMPIIDLGIGIGVDEEGMGYPLGWLVLEDWNSASMGEDSGETYTPAVRCPTLDCCACVCGGFADKAGLLENGLSVAHRGLLKLGLECGIVDETDADADGVCAYAAGEDVDAILRMSRSRGPATDRLCG